MSKHPDELTDLELRTQLRDLKCEYKRRREASWRAEADRLRRMFADAGGATKMVLDTHDLLDSHGVPSAPGAEELDRGSLLDRVAGVLEREWPWEHE